MTRRWPSAIFCLMDQQRPKPSITAFNAGLHWRAKWKMGLAHLQSSGGDQIRPGALGRSNCLFVGSPRSGKRAAAIMSLIQSARLNGHDPYAYLKDVLTRMP